MGSKKAIIPFSMPRMGPFRVRAGHVPKEVSALFLWFLLFGGVGGLFGWLSWRDSGRILETTRIWEQGQETRLAGFRGKVRTTNFVFKEYSLTVRYITKDKQRHKIDLEFSRFFTGPSKDSAYTVRYLPKNPKKATISWAYEARFHGWAFVALVAMMSLLMFAGFFAMAKGFLNEYRLLRKLSRRGELRQAKILSFQEMQDTNSNAKQYAYDFAWTTDKSYEARFVAKSGKEMPLQFDDDHLVLLVNPMGGEYLVIRYDGDPLVL